MSQPGSGEGSRGGVSAFAIAVLRFRLHDQGIRENRDHGPSGEALPLWGGIGAEGIPRFGSAIQIVNFT